MVAQGAEVDIGYQLHVAKHGDMQGSPLGVSQSLVDLGGVVQDVPGQDGRFSTGNTLLNVASDAPDGSGKGWIGQASRDEVGVWNGY